MRKAQTHRTVSRTRLHPSFGEGQKYGERKPGSDGRTAAHTSSPHARPKYRSLRFSQLFSLTSAQLAPGFSETWKHERNSATLGEVSGLSPAAATSSTLKAPTGSLHSKSPVYIFTAAACGSGGELSPAAAGLSPSAGQPGFKTQARWGEPGVLACWSSCCCPRKSHPSLPNHGAHALPRHRWTGPSNGQC